MAPSSTSSSSSALGGMLRLLLFLVPQAAPASADVRLGSLKFKVWFYYWEASPLGDILTSDCAAEVDDYWTNNSTYPWKCSRALDCILGKTSPSSQQMLANSLVLLGMMPAMLSTLGPNLAESAMLSLERPVLSLLLSLGSPAVAVTRILTYSDPFATIRPSPNSSKFVLPDWAAAMGHHPVFSCRHAVLAVEYAVAIAATINVVDTSIDLGLRSVSSFDCDTNFLPLLWVLLPGAIHVISMLAFALTPKAVASGDDGDNPAPRRGTETKTVLLHTMAPTRNTIVAQSIATGLAVGHIIFGTMIFSGLLFLMVSDAVPVIFRYALSAVACRFINQYELARMSEKYRVERVESLDRSWRRFLVHIPRRGRAKPSEGHVELAA